MEIVFSHVQVPYLLHDFSYVVSEGKIVSFCGASAKEIGRLLTFVDKPSRGELRIGDITIKSRSSLEKTRNSMQKIGSVFTHREWKEDTVYKELCSHLNEEDKDRRVKQACKMVLLEESLLDRNPQTLSSKESKKLSLACALIGNPDVLVLEDFSYGFSHHELEYYQKLFHKLCDTYHKTIILLEDSSEFLCGVVDTICVLANSEKVYEGDQDAFFDSELYQYIEMPEVIAFLFYLQERGHFIGNHREMKEVLKAIYRDVAY